VSNLGSFLLSSIGFDLMDWGYVHKTWDKWASTNIGPSELFIYLFSFFRRFIHSFI